MTILVKKKHHFSVSVVIHFEVYCFGYTVAWSHMRRHASGMWPHPRPIWNCNREILGELILVAVVAVAQRDAIGTILAFCIPIWQAVCEIRERHWAEIWSSWHISTLQAKWPRVNLMYTGTPVLRVTFTYKGSILCTTDPYTIRVNLMYSPSRAISR